MTSTAAVAAPAIAFIPGFGDKPRPWGEMVANASFQGRQAAGQVQVGTKDNFKIATNMVELGQKLLRDANPAGVALPALEAAYGGALLLSQAGVSLDRLHGLGNKATIEQRELVAGELHAASTRLDQALKLSQFAH